MQITVRYFASLREALGSVETLEVAEGTTVAALRELLCQRSPEHARVLHAGRALRAALDQALVDNPERVVIRPGAELAYFPPVTGG